MDVLTGLPKGVFYASKPPANQRARFPFGLGENGVHEICERAHGDMAALTGFALTAMHGRGNKSANRNEGPVIWVRQSGLAYDHGSVMQAGLSQLRTPLRALLTVSAYKRSEALWVTEEAIRSGAASLVIAELDGADFTASRRLTLASSRHGVPVILLMPYTRNGSTAATARWRVSPRPSALNRFDPNAPGPPRWQAVLERTRQSPHLAGSVYNLDFNDETLSLSVAAGLAAHTLQPRQTG